METRVRSFFVAVLILACGGVLRVECLNCTEVLSGCRCKGHGVDIDISKAFDYPYNITNNPDNDNPQKYSYYFSPCAPLETCGTTAAPNTAFMCQHNLLSTDDRDAALGTNQGIEWDGDNEKSFTIRYKGGDPDDKKKERWTEIQVTVGEKADIIEYSQEDDSPADHHTYSFTMTLKSDKPNLKGPGSIVGYIGIVIILLAIISLVLYFIIGTAILYFVKGARGLEAFPNYAFWKDLPVLIKDGCCFTISPCRNRISNKGKYQPL